MFILKKCAVMFAVMIIFVQIASFTVFSAEKDENNPKDKTVKSSETSKDVKADKEEALYPTKIYFAKNNRKTVTCGYKIKLKVMVTKKAKYRTVTYSSSNPEIAYVKKGYVIGKSPGTAVITAETANGLTAELKITVKENKNETYSVYPSKIYFDESSAKSVRCGYKIKLKVMVTKRAKERAVTYKSIDTHIAYVDKGYLIGKSPGTAVITAETKNGLTAELKVTVKSNPERNDYYMPDSFTIKGFKTVLQLPELPTGCEITALTQTLNYYGYKVSKTTMAEKYLNCSEIGTTTFDKAFMQNPFDDDSYGCYAPVIKNAAERYLNDNGIKHTATDITGTNASKIYEKVSEGCPVIVWATMSMSEPLRRFLWTTSDNEKVYWMRGEHCMTIIGYDFGKGTVTMADPLKGEKVYDMKLFEKRYNQLGKQAVIITGRHISEF